MQNNKYKQGDILVDNSDIFRKFRKILGVCGDVYFLSHSSPSLDNEKLKNYYGGYTQLDLDRIKYKLYEPPKEVEMTVAEISEALGKTVKVVE